MAACHVLPHSLLRLPIFHVVVGEEEVEDDSALVDAERLHDVDVHHVAVPINEQVGIEVAVGDGIAEPLIFPVRLRHLHRRSVEQLNFELIEVEFCCELFMGVEAVVASVEAVINEDLPVTVHRVDFTMKELEVVPAGGFKDGIQVLHIFSEGPRVVLPLDCFAIEIEEDEWSPSIDSDGL